MRALAPCFACLLSLLIALGGAASPSPAALTDEDVVRMLVAGRSVQEVLREIDRREPAFDVAPEMLDELRRASVPESVISAMVLRQAELEADAPAVDPTAPSTNARGLRIVFDRSRTLSLALRIDPQLAAEWELGNAPEDRDFADLALYVACQTPDHVPDQWRLRSPLGRDFTSMPRHRLLEFRSATTEAEIESGGRRLQLELPTEIDIPLEPGVAHDLSIGLAVDIGGHYRRVVDDVWEGVVVDDGLLEQRARAKGRSVRRFEVKWLRDDDEDEDDELGEPE